MKMNVKYFLLFLLGVVFYAPNQLNAQPANDSCANAISFGALAQGSTQCLAGSLNGANVEYPLIYQAACNPVPDTLPDVWYSFVATGNEANLSITASTMIAPTINVYQGSCGSFAGLGCFSSGLSTIPSSTIAPLTPGNTYYLQITGSTPTDTGDFTLCVQASNNASLCIQTQTLAANPLPYNGTYQAGQTVTFTYTVSNYVQQSSNWFHGVVPQFGSGWDLATLTNLNPAASCDGNGVWGWFNTCTSTATGLTVGPGFFYDTPSGGPPIDGIPGNNFGDNCSVNTWTFQWTVTAKDSCPPGIQGEDLGITVFNYADGESGSWTSFACQPDPNLLFSATLNCCPKPIITKNDISCPGSNDGSVTATGTGTPPFEYEWKDSLGNFIDSTQTISNLSPGKYFITVVDDDFCFRYDSVTINEANALLAVDSINNIACFGEQTGSIYVNVQGGIPPYNFIWSPNISSSDSVINAFAGVYILQITDSAGCFVRDTFTITQPSAPLSISGTKNDISCFGANDGHIQVSASGGTSPYQYSLNGGAFASDSVFNNLIPGNYTVVLRDTNMCIDSVSFTIIEPSLLTVTLADSVNPTCFGGNDGSLEVSVAGGSPPYNYVWNTSPTQTNPFALGLTSGTYTVYVTDSSGCMDSLTTSIVDPVQWTSSFTISTPNTCETDSVIVTYTGNGNAFNLYNWDFQGATIISGGGAGPYVLQWPDSGIKNVSLQVTDTFGCASPITTNSVYIKDIPTINTGGPVSVLCFGDSIQLSASASGGDGTYTYVWYPTTNMVGVNSANPTVAPTFDMTYYVFTISNGCVSDTDSVFVDVKGAPTVSTVGDTAGFCAGSGGVTIQAIGANSGGFLGPLSYVWTPSIGLDNPNAQNPIANPSTSKYFYVQVVDSFGCQSAWDSIYVQVNDLPIVDVSNDDTICAGSAGVTISGNVLNPNGGSYTYQWYPSTGLSCPTCISTNASPTTTTIYTLVATSTLTGCSSDSTAISGISSVTVHVLNRPSVEAGPDKYACAGGDSVTIDGFGFGTTAANGYSYSWSPTTGLSDASVANPKALPNSTTVYFLTVTDNSSGCVSLADSMTVFVNPIPIVNAGNMLSICEEDSIQLTPINPPAGAGITYSWSPGNTLSDSTTRNPIAFPSSTTNYTLTVFENGCSASDVVTVNVTPKPDFTAGDNHTICYLSSVQLNAQMNANFTNFFWTPATGLSDPNVINPIASPTNTTWYYLHASNGICDYVDSVLVTVRPGLAVDILADGNAVDQIISCNTDSVQLDVFGGSGATNIQYTWTPSTGLSNPNIRNPKANPDVSTTYTVLVNDGGCTATDTIRIIAAPRAIPEFITSSPIGCGTYEVNFLNLTAGGTAFIWDFGDGTTSTETNPSHIYLSEGAYTVTLTALGTSGCNGNISKDSVIVVKSAINAFFESNYTDTLYLPDANVQFTDKSSGEIISWLWDLGDGTISNEQNPFHKYQNAGEYEVKLTVTDQQSCVDEYILPIKIEVKIPTLSIPNVFTPNGDGVNDEFLPKLNNTSSVQGYSLVIYDRWGKKVFETTSPTQGWIGDANGSGKAAEGTYFYVLKTKDKTINGNVSLLR